MIGLSGWRNLLRYGQTHLAAELREARIVFVAQDERVEEEAPDSRVAGDPGPIEPLKGRFGIVTQRIDLSDLISRYTGVPLDQRLERGIGGAPVATDLARKGEGA